MNGKKLTVMLEEGLPPAKIIFFYLIALSTAKFHQFIL